MAKFEFLQGKCMWARLNDPDVEYNTWSVRLYLTPDSYNKVMKLKEGTAGVDGILNEVKKDDEGYFITLRRPLTKEWGGKRQQLTPPILVDKDNQPFIDYIGNGSDITAKVTVYEYTKPFKKGKGTAIRLEAVKVDNLVPYKKEQMSSFAQEAVKGLSEVKPQSTGWN
jgi:hypothetical protein